MVECAVADAVFHALSHEARRGMLQRLADHGLSVGELVEPLEMSFAAASKHVAVLERAGLVHRSVVGGAMRCGWCPAREVEPQIGGRHRVWQIDPDGTDVGGTAGASKRNVPLAAHDQFEAQMRDLYHDMARIVLTSTWVRLNDFVRTAPRAVERLAQATARPAAVAAR